MTRRLCCALIALGAVGCAGDPPTADVVGVRLPAVPPPVTVTASPTIAVATATPSTMPPAVTASPSTAHATTIPVTSETIVTSEATVAPAVPVRSGAIVSPTHSVGRPLSISVPAIGAEGLITPTGVLADGTVDVPADPSVAGWFEPGPKPGERGPAVVMGHVDSRSYGPGIFYRLRELQVGDIAIVDTETGQERFIVTSVEQYPKDGFPTERVYGPVPTRELRLITCGGSFDRSVRSYRDNIIAFLVPEADQ